MSKSLDLNLLVSFPYFSNRVLEHVRSYDRVNLLVDSGAFTAKKQGKTIEMDDYCEFIERVSVKPYHYFTLDVVGDAAMTHSNWQTMCKRGFKPIPIWTRGESVETLRELFRQSDAVAIGGITKHDRDPGGRLFQFMEVARKFPLVRTHWLGFTVLQWVRTLKPKSVDSSSWTGGLRYGSLDVYMGAGKMVRVNKSAMGARIKPDVMERIRHMGFPPSELLRKASWHGGQSFVSRICVNSWLRYARDVQRATGTKYYLAAASADAVEMIIQEHKRISA